MKRCFKHDVDISRTNGWCPGCEVERQLAAAGRMDELADIELQRAIQSGKDGAARWEKHHLDVMREITETAALLKDVARDCQEALEICRQLDELGPHSHERCPCDDETHAERDRVARADFVSWSQGTQ